MEVIIVGESYCKYMSVFVFNVSIFVPDNCICDTVVQILHFLQLNEVNMRKIVYCLGVSFK